ncbi:ABC transporter ATP-binding protein [Longirhabdus pacifica]|uniref:ABC transporter ATP-binding protein n=1 Tax=Longirhabdus pacifica TaxID=2305227 RepID=UPI0010088134|nr:ABC transporter ATP-binding protein [Longirhabdus pacifica]
MSFVTIENISHVYIKQATTLLALEEINLAIQQGEFISFLGPSGCGKSTLLSIISGLLKPTFGSVKLEGERVVKPSKHIGHMFQQDFLLPWKTIEENSWLGHKIMGTLDASIKEEVHQLLAAMGLGDVYKKYPHELSGGMRQRVALVRTIAVKPKLVLLDEAFSALDVVTKLQLENMTQHILEKHQMTSILVTHDFQEAIAMSDRVVLLHHNPGRIRKIFEVPIELRRLDPVDARNHYMFTELSQEIWEALNRDGTATA